MNYHTIKCENFARHINGRFSLNKAFLQMLLGLSVYFLSLWWERGYNKNSVMCPHMFLQVAAISRAVQAQGAGIRLLSSVNTEMLSQVSPGTRLVRTTRTAERFFPSMGSVMFPHVWVTVSGVETARTLMLLLGSDVSFPGASQHTSQGVIGPPHL